MTALATAELEEATTVLAALAAVPAIMPGPTDIAVSLHTHAQRIEHGIRLSVISCHVRVVTSQQG